MKHYGAETAKAVANFGQGETDAGFIRAYALVKKSCIAAIQATEQFWEHESYSALIAACDIVASGARNDSFPLSLRQGGAGTSCNMNMNEVLASVAQECFWESHAAERVFHPINDCNRYQSTNDTFTTALTIALLERITALESLIVSLQSSLTRLENLHPSLMMTGRTEMQNALPITFSQLIAGWTGPFERDRWRVNKLKERFRTIALGGTAIGTCFPATRDYLHEAELRLRTYTGLNLSRSQSLTDEIANADKYAEAATVFSIIAANTIRLAGDIMLHTSSLAGELTHPELQSGSTIMAAKTNPVMAEFATGCAVRADAATQAVTRFASMGSFQLNAYLPFIADALFDAADGLRSALDALGSKLIPSLAVNEERIAANLCASNLLLNMLLPEIGYDRVKELYAEFNASPAADHADFVKRVAALSGISADRLTDLFRPENATAARRNS